MTEMIRTFDPVKYTLACLDGLCLCPCHEVGTSCMHAIQCCHLCYEKYIVDGKVDFNLLEISILRKIATNTITKLPCVKKRTKNCHMCSEECSSMRIHEQVYSYDTDTKLTIHNMVQNWKGSYE